MDIGSFFEKQAKYRTLTKQTMIGLLAGATFALDIFVIYLLMGDARPTYGGVALLLMMIYFVTPLISWVVLTAAFYLIGRAVNARIQYGTLLRVTGWGMAPLIGLGVSWGVGRYLALRSIDPCNHPAFSCSPENVAGLSEQAQAIFTFASTATGEPIFQALFAIGLLFALGATALWIEGAERVSTLTRQGALIAVVPPVVVVLVVFTLFTFP